MRRSLGTGEVVAFFESGGVDCSFMEFEEWQEIARIARSKNGKLFGIVVSKKGEVKSNTLILLNMGINVKRRFHFFNLPKCSSRTHS